MMNVVNISAKGKFDVKVNQSEAILDLHKLCMNTYDCIYDTSKFQCLKIQYRKCGTTITLYSSGKFWVFGAKDFEAVLSSTKKIEKLIEKCGYSATISKMPEIKTITAHLDYTNKIKIPLSESVLSKTELAKYRLPSEIQNTFCIRVEQTTVKICPNGKVQIYCAKTFEALKKIEDLIQEIFIKCGLI
jgi:TATA-box binding protein (TBP) (component of TFIID and TFIIIB)